MPAFAKVIGIIGMVIGLVAMPYGMSLGSWDPGIAAVGFGFFQLGAFLLFLAIDGRKVVRRASNAIALSCLGLLAVPFLLDIGPRVNVYMWTVVGSVVVAAVLLSVYAATRRAR
jgi:peptidoglycan/LPS O-acetylase OafA/YrhL